RRPIHRTRPGRPAHDRQARSASEGPFQKGPSLALRACRVSLIGDGAGQFVSARRSSYRSSPSCSSARWIASAGPAAVASTVRTTAVFSRLGTFNWNVYSRVVLLYVILCQFAPRAATAPYSCSSVVARGAVNVRVVDGVTPRPGTGAPGVGTAVIVDESVIT